MNRCYDCKNWQGYCVLENRLDYMEDYNEDCDKYIKNRRYRREDFDE